MTSPLRSACRMMFSRFPLRGRRSFRRVWGGGPIAALEERVLLAVDLRPTGGSFDITPTTVRNQYAVSFDFAVENQGTTQAKLSGTLQDFSDNVKIRAVFSTDNVYGNSDDVEIGVATFGTVGDFIQVSLAGGGATTLHFSGTINANPNFKFFIFKADSTEQIAESDEADNVFPGINVPEFTVADSFNFLSFQVPPNEYVAGTTRTLAFQPHFVAIDEISFVGTKLAVKWSQQKPGDQLSVASWTFNGETLKRAGKNLKLGSNAVASISGGKKGEALAIHFNSGTDNVLINQVLKNITFKSKKSQPGLREIEATLDLPSGQHFSGGAQEFNVKPRS